MAIQGRTRAQLRVAVGYNLGALLVSSASSAGNAGGTTLPDASLSAAVAGANGSHAGKWVVLTSGGNNGDIRQSASYDGVTTTITLRTAATGQITSGMTYELWNQAYPPAAIHTYFNNAIIEATGRAFDPEESLALAADGKSIRFAIPSQFAIITKGEYRSFVPSKIIHQASTTWTTSTNANFTQLADTQDRKLGSASLRLTIAAAASANDFVGQNISSIDISGYTHLELWIKSTVATAAADLHILLDDTAGGGSPLETLAIPALVANIWTYVRVALANPQLDTAIVNVRFRYTVDIGATVIWLNDIKAINNNESEWSKIPARLYTIDRQAREIVFSDEAKDVAGYSLLKITGGDNPALLSAETSVTEVDDDFVIARATELALMSRAGGPQVDMEAHLQKAAYWRTVADKAKMKIRMPSNTRLVGD